MEPTRVAHYPERLRARSIFLVWGPPSHGPRTKVFARRLGIEPVFVYATRRRGPWIAPWKYTYQAVATLVLLLRRRPDVVFVQSPPSVAAVVVSGLTALLGGRFVVDAHSGAFGARWTRPAWLHRAVARRAASTIVTNEHHRDLIESYGGRAVIIRDVPTAFDGAPPTDLPPDGFRVLAVNTFAPDEPVAELVAAAAELPDVTFHITGDTSRPGFVMPADVPANVHFTGYVPDAEYYGLMRASDAVLCLTTREHTMQRGACEALSMGVPIVTSDTALLRTYFRMGTVHVRNDRTGIRHGIERMVADHDRFSQEIRTLQDVQRTEWDAALSELVAALR